MERLSLLDAEFLHLEDRSSPMHIACVSIFEGPAPKAEDVRKLLASKLHRIPRYRQRIRVLPFEVGRPVWVDDPHFDLAYHVRGTAIPSPGGDEELCALVGRVMSSTLDREKPLWESWVVEGLADPTHVTSICEPDYGPALAAFEDGLRETAERLRAGDFRPPRPEERDCGNCGWASICRTGYATEGR